NHRISGSLDRCNANMNIDVLRSPTSHTKALRLFSISPGQNNHGLPAALLKKNDCLRQQLATHAPPDSDKATFSTNYYQLNVPANLVRVEETRHQSSHVGLMYPQCLGENRNRIHRRPSYIQY